MYTAGVSDPTRAWALTRKALVVEGVLSGEAKLVSCSMRPDRALIGREIYLHCGSSLPAITPLRENVAARELVAKLATYRGGSFDAETWREGLTYLQEISEHRVRGKARLVAAFACGTAYEFESGKSHICVFQPDRWGRHYLGDWQRYVGSGTRQVAIGKFTKPVWSDRLGKYHGTRWVWCFEDPQIGSPLFDQALPGRGGAKERGQCGVWDLLAWAELCRKERLKQQKEAAA